MNLIWSPTAISDMKSIRDYIACENPSAANKVANRIKQSVQQLAEFPLSGRSGRVSGTREIVVPGTSYIAAYILHGSDVQIVAVLHGRQSWPETLQRR